MFQHFYTNTVVIGLGPTGLAVVNELSIQNIKCIGIDSGNIGHTIETMFYNNFRLATSQNDFGFAVTKNHLSRDELLILLRRFAWKHKDKLFTNTAIKHINKGSNEFRYKITTNCNTIYFANNIVVCIGAHNAPKYSKIVEQIPPSKWLHSCDYKSPQQFHYIQSILIVGSGLAALCIARDIKCSNHKIEVILACKDNQSKIENKNLHNYKQGHEAGVIPSLAELQSLGIKIIGALETIDNGQLIFTKHRKKVHLPLHSLDKIIFAIGYKFTNTIDMSEFDLKTWDNHVPINTDGVTPIPGIYFAGASNEQNVVRIISTGTNHARIISADIKNKNPSARL